MPKTGLVIGKTQPLWNTGHPEKEHDMTVEEKARKIVKDMTVPCEDGIINLRVGAIIMDNTFKNKFLHCLERCILWD